MILFTDYLKAELAYLERGIGVLKDRKEQYPDGKLIVSSSNGSVQYYIKEDSDDPSEKGSRSRKKYIHKEHIDLAKLLAQKDYDNRFLKYLEQRLNVIKKTLHVYQNTDLVSVLDHSCEGRKALIEPVYLSEEAYAKQWMEKTYHGKPFDENDPDFTTVRGERVRSKSAISYLNWIQTCLSPVFDISFCYRSALKIKEHETYLMTWRCDMLRFGINCDFRGTSPEEWAGVLADAGCRAASFPLTYQDPVHLIDAYARAAKERDIKIAEIGAWSNPLAADPQERALAMEKCVEQLKLADYLNAGCCVNCGGSAGSFWCAYAPENLTEAFYQRVVECIQKIIDKAEPVNTVFALEPMPWIVPTGPDDYVRLIRDVGPAHFKAHLDICNWMNDIPRFADQRCFMDEVFEKLHGQMVCYHFKDLNLLPGITVRFEEAPVGDGMLDVDYFIKKVKEEDPDASVLIEHLPGISDYIKSMHRVNKRFGCD